MDTLAKIISEKLSAPWQEITAERFHDMLNVLPPQKWRTVAGVEMFRMCEYYTDNITSHFARIGERYFTAHRRTSADYSALAAEVHAANSTN